MIFNFKSEVKSCEATLSPPIYREAVADRVNRAICSALCGANRVCEASINDLL
ncbi:hypothetical protein HMPREF1139_2106 [Campylobacter sp. FOBRC14]|nr:hypothetical protein HMPREF1139_2106 [Campylobacter sp. FOBRC14]